MSDYSIAFSGLASTSTKVTADTPQAAIDMAEPYVSLCHQCGHEAEIGDEWEPVEVIDLDSGEVVWTAPDAQERAADYLDKLAKARNDLQEFALAIGFGSDHRPEGHGVWVPELADMVDSINEALSTAQEHIECPVVCENCGERLADVVCEHCHGSGCGSGTASGAYEECEWCAGARKVHPGCVGETYSDLAGALAKARNMIEQVRACVQRTEERWVDSERAARPLTVLGVITHLRAILDEAERGEGS